MRNETPFFPFVLLGITNHITYLSLFLFLFLFLSSAISFPYYPTQEWFAIDILRKMQQICLQRVRDWTPQRSSIQYHCNVGPSCENSTQISISWCQTNTCCSTWICPNVSSDHSTAENQIISGISLLNLLNLPSLYQTEFILLPFSLLLLFNSIPNI